MIRELKIKIIHEKNTNSKNIDISWELSKELLEIKEFYFEVWRGDSELDSSFEFVGTTKINSFRDNEANIWSKWRETYYLVKVKVDNIIIFELKGVLNRNRGSLLIKKLRKDFNKGYGMVMKNYGNVFTLKTTKEPCPECFDEDYGESRNRECIVCGGIGFVKNYNNGITVSYKSGTSPEMPVGKDGISPTENRQKTFEIKGSEVAIHPEDLFMDKNGTLYRVENVSPNVLFNEVLSQQLYCKQMDLCDPEYSANLTIEKDVSKDV